MKLAEKVQSRKFLLAVSACVFFAFSGAFDQIAQVVIAYLAVQAAVDGFVGYQEAKSGGQGD